MASPPSPQCLVYVSKISSNTAGDLRSTVRNILTQAQHLNARDNVTGLLVFNHSFLPRRLRGSRIRSTRPSAGFRETAAIRCQLSCSSKLCWNEASVLGQ